MKNGIPIATPVFDGAKELDVTSMLKKQDYQVQDKHIFGMEEQVKNLIEQLLLEQFIC